MKKIMVLLLLFFLISACTNNDFQNDLESQDKSVVEDDSIDYSSIIEKNKDGSDYLENYPNTQIVKNRTIQPSEFSKLRNSTDFPALYEDLPQKELTYVEFLGNTNLKLATIIDEENKSVVNIVGIYVMGVSS